MKYYLLKKTMAYCNLDKAIYDGMGKYDIPPIDAFNGNLGLPLRFLKRPDFPKAAAGDPPPCFFNGGFYEVCLSCCF